MSALALPKLPEIIRPQRRLYTPPPGYYDLPFTWTFDASNLSQVNPNPNQLVYLQGGYGDFVLRRVVGLSRILASPSTYQIQDRNLSNIQFLPVVGASADDIGMAPETTYRELDAIRFSLGIASLPSVGSQIAFQGVRRMKGNPPRNPTYRAIPKTYTYVMTAPLVSGAAGTFVTGRVLIQNYDFELYQIIVMDGVPASREYGDDQSVILISANQAGPQGDNITIQLDFTPSGGFPANQPSSVSVVTSGLDTTITYLPLTDGSGHVIYNPPTQGTNLQLLQAFAANPQAAALVTASLHSGPITASGFGKIPSPGNLQNGGVAALTSPQTAMAVYDQNKVWISNQPVLDIYVDGGPGGVYQNGAVVTPLWYQKDSQIQIDFYSLGVSPPPAPIVYLVGRKYYPC